MFSLILTMLQQHQQHDKNLFNNITCLTLKLKLRLKEIFTIDILKNFCNSSIFVNLKTLELNFCNINDSIIKELSEILNNNKHLTMLNLSGNYITDDGASVIISKLQKTGLTINLQIQESGPIKIKHLSPQTTIWI